MIIRLRIYLFIPFHYKHTLLGIEHFPSIYLEVLGIAIWYLEFGFWYLEFDRVLGISD